MQIATLYPRALATPTASAAHGESASDFDRFLTARIQSEAAERGPARNRQENFKSTDGATDGATAASQADLHAVPDEVCPVLPAPTPLQTSQDPPASASLSDDFARNQPAAGPGLAPEATVIPAEISVVPPEQAGADLSVDQPAHLVAAGSPPSRILHGFDAMTEAADNLAGNASPVSGPDKEGGMSLHFSSATGRGLQGATLSKSDHQIALAHPEPGKGAAQNGSAQPAPAQQAPASFQATTAQAGAVFAGQGDLSAVTLTMRPAASASALSPVSAMAAGAAPADQPRMVITLPHVSDQDADLGNLALQRMQPPDLSGQQDQGFTPGQERAAQTDPLALIVYDARSKPPVQDSGLSPYLGAGGRGGAQPLRMGADLLIPPADANDPSAALGQIAGSLPTVPTPGSGLALSAPPLPAQTPIQQVSQMVVHVAQNGPDGPIDIALHPEELGQIRFEMTTSGNRLHITLFVERPESLELFRRHISDLMADMRQSGFGQTSLSFGNWSQRDHQPAPPTPVAQAALRPTQTQQGWRETDRTPAQTYDTGRLDLRL